MLEINGIDVYYRDLQALWNVSLIISKGKIVALVGSNGAGKSTLLRTIMGLIRPTNGTIMLSGLLLNEKPTHEIVEAGVCLIPEGRGLFPKMSIMENLEMGAFLSRARSRKKKMLELVYGLFPVLNERRSQIAESLSGGEQQMLAIGRGLMSFPILLLCDEVSLGLSPLFVQQILKGIKRINEEADVSVLIVDQNIYMALKIADVGYLIENGQIVGHGEAAFLLSDDGVKKAYLGKV